VRPSVSRAGGPSRSACLSRSIASVVNSFCPPETSLQPAGSSSSAEGQAGVPVGPPVHHRPPVGQVVNLRPIAHRPSERKLGLSSAARSDPRVSSRIPPRAGISGPSSASLRLCGELPVARAATAAQRRNPSAFSSFFSALISASLRLCGELTPARAATPAQRRYPSSLALFFSLLPLCLCGELPSPEAL